MQKETPQQQAGHGERISGWVEAGFYVIAIAILGVMNAFAISQGAHPIVFILYSLLIAAAGMLSVTGLGNEAVPIMLSPRSWIVGIAAILVEICYCLALVTLSPAEGTLVLRLSIPMALVVGWLVFHRSPGLGAWIGAGIVGAGVATLLWLVDLNSQTIGLFYGFLAAAAICLRGYASEFHPWNRAARTVMAKMQITGLVVLVTGFACLILVAASTVLVASGYLERSSLFAAPSDLWHWPTLVIALLMGGLLFTAMNYLQLSSVVKIQTENFIATSAFMPLAALLMQSLAVSAGIINTTMFDWRLVPGGVLVIIGVLVLIASRARR
ncbi:MAG: hypothetical protein DIU63_03525 [Proteobacteria bacterium]|jgi:drug/metabolite transporter (DMT)-like permease|nr:MAG: hypothetical protein DIU63_03525 [Pseudomonadota bacterium]